MYHVFISINTILNKKNIGEGSHTWKNDLPPTTKRFKESHRDNVLENVFFRLRRGSNNELVVFLRVVSFCQFPYLTFVTNSPAAKGHLFG